MNRVLSLTEVWPSDWRRPPALSLLAGTVVAFIVLPLLYVLWNALTVPGSVWVQIWQGRVPGLLWNTLRLALGVAVLTLLWGIGLAWLTVRYDFPGRRVWSWSWRPVPKSTSESQWTRIN